MRRNTASSVPSRPNSLRASRTGSAMSSHSTTSTGRSARATDSGIASNIGSSTTSGAIGSIFPQDSDSMSNVKVVVRSRGRNDREVKQKSAVVVDTSLSKTEIAVRTSQEGNNSKVFSVDRVFGSEADQGMIFDEIVSPMVEDFISGMNCTIFAYGQTGTGKTYTMSGDDSLSANYYTPEAGIIPRVLFQVFNSLSLKSQDYSVSVSFIELYNEELKDLLDDDETKKVRIFDDQAKKSVVINGLSESYVTSAVNGLKILQEGLRKRQVAFTKMNDASSRSHSIFTLTVCSAFDDTTGEYAMKSKINLVDLAGSENIGKSGAENKRAREAGMINQSLLTLGRVINALVDKSQHIPYRESKLTRLLQDSLGGRTKTCIIATVSPALVNIEETLSTLEYASRAKSIKNKPQINSLNSFKSTLKEFSLQFEKLQYDLTATRKKNGIYLDPANYKEIMDEHSSQAILVKDQQRKLDTIQAQLKTTRESHETLYRDFVEVNKKLQESQSTLVETSKTLKDTQEVLANTKIALKKETALKQAYAGTEGQLQSIGGELIKSLDEAVNDTEFLHSKIENMQSFDKNSSQLITSSVGHIVDYTHAIESKILEYNDYHGQLNDMINTNFERVIHAERQKLEDAVNLLRDNINNVDILGDSMTGQQRSHEKEDDKFYTEQESKLRAMFKQIIDGGLEEMRSMSDHLLADLTLKMEESHKMSRNDISSLLEKFGDIQSQYRNQMDTYINTISLHKEEAGNLVRSLQQQVSLKASTFNKELEIQKEKAAQDRMLLASKIAGLVDEYSKNEESRFISIGESAREMASIGADKKYGKELSDMISNKSLEVKQVYRDLLSKEEELRAEMEKARDDTSRETAKQLSENVRETISKNIEGLVQLAEGNSADLDSFFSELKHRSSDHTTQVCVDIRQLCKKVKTSFGTLVERLVNLQSHGLSSTDGLAVEDGEWMTVSEESLASIEEIKATLVALMGSMDEQRRTLLASTGDTPKRRRFEFARVLPQTNGQLVHTSPVKLEQVSAERSPLEEIQNSRPVTRRTKESTNSTRSKENGKNANARPTIPLKRRGSFTPGAEPVNTRPRLGQ